MLINMKLLLTSELVERLNAVPDLDITQMVLPESVMKIKDLSNYPTDKDGSLGYNTYTALLRDGTGVGVSCAKEQLSGVLSQFFELEK